MAVCWLGLHPGWCSFQPSPVATSEAEKPLARDCAHIHRQNCGQEAESGRKGSFPWRLRHLADGVFRLGPGEQVMRLPCACRHRTTVAAATQYSETENCCTCVAQCATLRPNYALPFRQCSRQSDFSSRTGGPPQAHCPYGTDSRGRTGSLCDKRWPKKNGAGERGRRQNRADDSNEKG